LQGSALGSSGRRDAGTQGLIEKGRLKRLTIMAADIGWWKMVGW
jgi:hypothetical protein